MKKLINLFGAFALLLAMAVSTVSCDKEDNQADKDYGLIGKWKTVRLDYSLYVNGNLEDEDTDDCTEEYGIFTFNEDGKGTVKYVDVEYGDSDIENFTWTRNGNILKILFYEHEELMQCEILKLEATTMELSIEEEYDYDGTFYKYVEVAVLERI